MYDKLGNKWADKTGIFGIIGIEAIGKIISGEKNASILSLNKLLQSAFLLLLISFILGIIYLVTRASISDSTFSLTIFSMESFRSSSTHFKYSISLSFDLDL
jgi:hypothetical protein